MYGFNKIDCIDDLVISLNVEIEVEIEIEK